MSRSFRARPLDVTKQLELVLDETLLDSTEGLPSREVVHNHAALDADNEKVGRTGGPSCTSRRTGGTRCTVWARGGRRAAPPGAGAGTRASAAAGGWRQAAAGGPRAAPLCCCPLRSLQLAPGSRLGAGRRA